MERPSIADVFRPFYGVMNTFAEDAKIRKGPARDRFILFYWLLRGKDSGIDPADAEAWANAFAAKREYNPAWNDDTLVRDYFVPLDGLVTAKKKYREQVLANYSAAEAEAIMARVFGPVSQRRSRRMEDPDRYGEVSLNAIADQLDLTDPLARARFLQFYSMLRGYGVFKYRTDDISARSFAHAFRDGTEYSAVIGQPKQVLILAQIDGVAPAKKKYRAAFARFTGAPAAEVDAAVAEIFGSARRVARSPRCTCAPKSRR